MLAAVYARVSTEEQAEKGTSLTDQVERCAARVRDLGLGEPRVYSDPGVSGATLDRAGLTALRDVVRAGEVKLIVCLDPDRLSRRLAHQLLLTEEFERADCRLEFLNFEWKNTSEGRLFYSLRGAIAEYEREKIRERTVRGKWAKARGGKIPSWAEPYGYRFDADTDELRVEPPEEEWVRRMFSWFTQDADLSLTALASRLDALGVLTKRGAPAWHAHTVKEMLQNPVYVGRLRVRRWERVRAQTKRGYVFRQRPEDEWIIVPAPAIVDEATWAVAQAKIAQIGRMRGRHNRNTYLLSGLCRCGLCGSPVTGHYVNPSKQSRKPYRYYACLCFRGHHLTYKRLGKCSLRSVNADALEALVWNRISAWLADPETFAAEARASLPRPEHERLEREAEEVEARLLHLRRFRDTLLRLASSGSLAEAELHAEMRRTREEMDCLQRRRDEVMQLLTRPDVADQDVEALRQIAAGLAGGLDNLPPAEKRRIITLLIERVTLYPAGRVVVTARIGGPTVGTPQSQEGAACQKRASLR